MFDRWQNLTGVLIPFLPLHIVIWIWFLSNIDLSIFPFTCVLCITLMLYGSNSREITNRLQWRKREETKRPIRTRTTELSFLSLPHPPRKNRTTSKSMPTKSRQTTPTDGPRPRNRGLPAPSPKWWVITTCPGLLNYNKLN